MGWLADFVFAAATPYSSHRRGEAPPGIRPYGPAQKAVRNSYGFGGANSPATDSLCTSQAETPALRAAIIFSGSTGAISGRWARGAEACKCSVAVQSSP